MSKFDEQIIVVPRKVLFNDEKNAFNGFLHKNNPVASGIHTEFGEQSIFPRGHALGCLQPSISLEYGLPIKPEVHVHVNDPSVSLQ